MFASAAAVGAGLAVNVDYLTHHAAIGARGRRRAAFTVPVALFLLAVWALQVRPHHLARWHGALAPATAVLVLAATLASEPVLVTGLLVATMIGGLPGRPPPPGGRPGALAQLGTDQVPSPAISWSASSGPQVPGSYS